MKRLGVDCICNWYNRKIYEVTYVTECVISSAKPRLVERLSILKDTHRYKTCMSLSIFLTRDFIKKIVFLSRRIDIQEIPNVRNNGPL